jgi:hypothetical protein
MSVELSSRERALCAQLVGDYLDHIEIGTPEEIPAVVEALRALSEPRQPHVVAPRLRERIQSIQGLIDEPEMYVQNPALHDAFRNVVRDRVAREIANLVSLTPEGTLELIRQRSSLRSEATQYQSMVSERQAPAPDSDAHVVSDEQWLAGEQARFQANLDPVLERLRQTAGQDSLAALMLSMYESSRGMPL